MSAALATGEAAAGVMQGATFGAVVAAASRQLADAGIESARREARLLVAIAAGTEAALVLAYPERVLDAAGGRRLADLLERRLRREPVSRLMGRREFWSLDFALSPATLDPRPDSETLIAAALDRLPDRAAPLRLLDFGTGTGCLLLALLTELPHAIGFGVDRAPAAAATARQNAAALGLETRAFFACGDWDAAISGRVDVILANPPYIRSDVIPTLAPEVARFDPRLALDGGADGLEAYRVLLPAAKTLLKPGGMAVFELGDGEAPAVAALADASGLVVLAIRPDLSGSDRCLVAGVS